MGAVFKISLPPSEKVVALALADHAHDDGTEARPGLDSLAVKCTLSRRQVQRVVHSLVAKGILVVQRPATPTMPVCYRFDLDENGALVGGDNLSRGDSLSGVGVTPVTRRGDTHVTQTVIEPSVEPSSFLRTAKAATPGQLNERFDRLWEIFPRKSDKIGARKQVHARLKSGVPFDELLEATRNYAQSRAGQDSEHTLYGKTFWNNERWRDWLDGGPELATGPRTSRPPRAAVDGAMAALSEYFNSTGDDRQIRRGPVIDYMLERYTLRKLGNMTTSDLRLIVEAAASQV